MNHLDVWKRAAKTAVQSFVGVVVLALSNLFGVFSNSGLTGLKTALLAVFGAAVAAAVSAVWNYYLQYKASS